MTSYFCLPVTSSGKASQENSPNIPEMLWACLNTSLIYRRIHFCRWLKKNTLRSVSSQKSSSMRWKTNHMIRPISFQVEMLKVKAGLGWLSWLTTQHVIFTLAELYFYGEALYISCTFTGIWAPVQASHESVVSSNPFIDDYL